MPSVFLIVFLRKCSNVAVGKLDDIISLLGVYPIPFTSIGTLECWYRAQLFIPLLFSYTFAESAAMLMISRAAEGYTSRRFPLSMSIFY